ncbi:unnamed protein product [Protopolystoma xenopodis]|uniref:Uncharacterized protein n=1 Tax=Protopolystoma xenopodis TaxID=117903 RepID=A0A3S5A8I1_9PLAT|nr:unnamed protein product [Protopolystoma xenopodis]
MTTGRTDTDAGNGIAGQAEGASAELVASCAPEALLDEVVQERVEGGVWLGEEGRLAEKRREEGETGERTCESEMGKMAAAVVGRSSREGNHRTAIESKKHESADADRQSVTTEKMRQTRQN